MNDYVIVAFVGRQGQGKTICMLAYAYYLSQMAHKPINTNMSGVDGVKTPQIRYFNQLFDLKDSVIMLDELHHDFDSRAFAKNAKRTQWPSQVRKLGQIVLYNTQQFHKIDKRLRDETTFVIQCRNLGGGIHRLTAYDALNYNDKTYLKESERTINVRPLYGRYDTRQVMTQLLD